VLYSALPAITHLTILHCIVLYCMLCHTRQLAMTGEISLTGKVLPVGGIKEKILAARRTGAHTVVLPASCRRDFQELPAYVKEALTVHFAASYDDVFRVAFRGTELRQSPPPPLNQKQQQPAMSVHAGAVRSQTQARARFPSSQ
jgi:ATP-dependent Lon protease